MSFAEGPLGLVGMSCPSGADLEDESRRGGEAERLLVFRGPRDVMGIVEIERAARGGGELAG